MAKTASAATADDPQSVRHAPLAALSVSIDREIAGIELRDIGQPLYRNGIDDGSAITAVEYESLCERLRVPENMPRQSRLEFIERELGRRRHEELFHVAPSACLQKTAKRSDYGRPRREFTDEEQYIAQQIRD